MAILLFPFIVAPIQQSGGCSIGAQNLAAVEDGSWAPVLVDCSMIWNLPCARDMPQVADGLVEPPAYLVNPPAGLGFGGTFAGARETGTWEEMPTRRVGAGQTHDHAEWGHLIEVDYPMPGNHFDVQSVPVPRWGWRGE